jgi:tRNA-2-methylthio-N6-dimethylallyladenosine synthase
MMVFLETYGCQMNEYDSELVRAILSEAGYAFTDDDLSADIIMINTCSVRDSAQRKVYGYIHELRHRRSTAAGQSGRGARPALFGILGCMATSLQKELLEDKALDLDFVVGPDSYKRLPEILKSIQEGQVQGFDVTLSDFETYADVYPARQGGVNAWVAIMRGCNNFCSFCVVPYARGRERCRPFENILTEVKRLADEGYKQVTLLGQNVNSYVHDGLGFAELLTAVAKVEGIRRIRFTAPHPKDFPDKLIRVIAKNPKVCKHVHLPLQAGNDRILRLMNRNYTRNDYIALVNRIRKAVPNVVLTTDLITGFPTETDNEFEDTVSIMKEIEFDSAFIFKYSPRPNTKAAADLKDDIAETKKTQRIVRLNKIQSDISLKRNQAYVGRTEEVLIEEAGKYNSDAAFGRSDGNKIVALFGSDLNPGEFVNAKIIRATPHQLKGRITTK